VKDSPRTYITKPSSILPTVDEKLRSERPCTVWEDKAAVNSAQRGPYL
jgi:hypothetical protein